MSFSKVTLFFQRTYTTLLCVLIVGNPLVFSSYTRSVFEVNKLLLLRIITLLILAFWAFKKLLDHYNGIKHPDEESYVIAGFSWKRVGLEIPSLLYVVVTLITCVFSTNVWLAIIGSYDRWEGIFTILNYVVLVFLVAKLVVKRSHFLIILTSLVIASMLSGVYGIFQSLGIDIMRWSADPTYRVFACINNPVHFCAFMGMLMPFIFALYLYFDKQVSKVSDTVRILGNSYSSCFFKRIVIFVLITLSYLFFLIDGLSAYFPVYLTYSFCFYLFYILYYTPFFKKNNIYLATMGVFTFLSFVFLKLSTALMIVLLSLIAVIYLVDALFEKEKFFKRFFYISLLMIFYVQLLSYSRATFVGFNLFMPFFFVLLSKGMAHLKYLKQIIFVCSIFLFFVFIVLFFMFNIYQYGLIFKSLFYIFMALFLGVFYLFNRRSYSFVPYITFSVLCLFFAVFCLELSGFLQLVVSSFTLFLILFFVRAYRSLLYVCFLFFLPFFFIFSQMIHMSFFYLYFACFILFVLVYVTYLMKKSFLMFNHQMLNYLLGGLLFVLLFFSISHIKANLFTFLYEFQLWYVSLYAVFVFLSVITCLALIYPIFSTYKRFVFMGAFLFLSAIVFLNINVSQSMFKTLDQKRSKSSFAYRSEQLLDQERTKKNSRIYMWTSVPKWFKDYPLFGSGLDTIKFLYPLYRDPRYGIYEGAHNYTPDRLHNEYLNTLVTKGLVGFLVYYLFYIGGFYVLLIKFLSNNFGSWKQYFCAASFVSVGVYLGQVLFNFGVLPTLVLFYMVMGLGLCLPMISSDKAR